MNANQKSEIRRALLDRLSKTGESANQIAKVLSVSSATISQIANNKFDLISNKMWLKISGGLSAHISTWQTVPTRSFQLIQNTLEKCKINADVFGISARAGSGKTLACEQYAANHENVIYLRCRESWNQRMFYSAFLQAMGQDPERYTVAEMVDAIIKGLEKRENCIVIWDEADKLRNKIILFIELYNELKGRVGFFICGTDKLRINIETGAKKNKLGYTEVLSRLGGKFLPLTTCSRGEIKAICVANGVTEQASVNNICDAYMATPDLRIVENRIKAYHKSSKLAA